MTNSRHNENTSILSPKYCRLEDYLFPTSVIGYLFAATFLLWLVSRFSPLLFIILSILTHFSIVYYLFSHVRWSRNRVFLFLVLFSFGSMDLFSTVGFVREGFIDFAIYEGNVFYRVAFSSVVNPWFGVMILGLIKVSVSLMIVREFEIYQISKKVIGGIPDSFFYVIFKLRKEIRQSTIMEDRKIRYGHSVELVRQELEAGTFPYSYYVYARVIYGSYWVYILGYFFVILYNSVLPYLSEGVQQYLFPSIIFFLLTLIFIGVWITYRLESKRTTFL